MKKKLIKEHSLMDELDEQLISFQTRGGFKAVYYEELKKIIINWQNSSIEEKYNTKNKKRN